MVNNTKCKKCNKYMSTESYLDDLVEHIKETGHNEFEAILGENGEDYNIKISEKKGKEKK